MSEVSEVRLESSWTLGDLLAGIIIEECELRNYIIKIREEWWKCSPRSRIRYKNSRTSVCLRPQWAQKRNWTSIILECRCVTLRTRFLMHFSRSDHCRNFSSCSVAGSSAGAVLWAAVRALGATYQGQNRLKRNQKGKMLSRKKPDMRWPHFLMQMGKLTNWHWLYGKSYLPIALTINLMTYHINLHYRVFVLHYQHLNSHPDWQVFLHAPHHLHRPVPPSKHWFFQDPPRRACLHGKEIPAITSYHQLLTSC